MSNAKQLAVELRTFQCLQKSHNFERFGWYFSQWSQNLISEIFYPSGFLPRREAPVISFSVRNVGFWNIRSTCHNKQRGTRRDSLAFLTSFSWNSIQDSRDVRHYESRVYDLWSSLISFLFNIIIRVYRGECAPLLVLKGFAND